MNKKSWIIFTIVFIGFVLFLGILYLRLISVRSDAAKAINDEILKPVKTIKVEPTETVLFREFLGRVEGGQTVDIRSNVGGWVRAINFERGETIRKNQVILNLYDERTEVLLNEARYNLEAARARMEETRRKYENNKKLLEKGIVAEDIVKSGSNQLESDKATVKALEASYQRVKWDYDKLQITSPIGGTVVEIEPDVGQEILVGEVVAKVVNLGTKKIIAGVDASLARLIKSGSDVELFLNNNGSGQVTGGTVVGVSRNYDDISGIYEVEISIPQSSQNNWWPGEIVTVRIPVRELENVVRVPRTSVLSDSEEIFVFVVEENGISRKVAVDVTWIDDTTGYVPAESFPDNTEIIIEGNTGLTSGQQVNVIN